MPITHTRIWQQWDNVGLEYLELIERNPIDGIVIESTVIGFEDKTPFHLRYRLRCLENYQVVRVMISLSGHQGLDLTRLATGQWLDEHNQPLPQLEGCHDIDISATPFTNTLPIRRLDWQAGQSRSLDMVYIRIPDLTIERATQQYTCLEKHERGSVFEYSQPGFKAILPIDSDGFVQNYPELFRRLS
ncbi:MAG: putative glycolipid-binding domain-containing protein [Anaerolineae bacterium]|nr:putative glycolipid-binding domain-containing protein [Anaerolineae bacterium]